MQYYIVAVGDDGDVLAIAANVVNRDGLSMTVESEGPDYNVAYDNQGDDSLSKWESARDCLAAVMPDDD